MADTRIHPETLAGQSPSADPFAWLRPRQQARHSLAIAIAIAKRSHRSHAEEVEAVFEEQTRLGRSMTPGEREAFVRGFHGQSYAAEVRMLAVQGLLDEDDEG